MKKLFILASLLLAGCTEPETIDQDPNDNDPNEIICPAMCFQNPNDINDDYCYNCVNVPVKKD